MRTTEQIAKIKADRETARQEMSKAREESANLRGQAEAMQDQIKKQMKAIQDRSPKNLGLAK